MADRRERLEDDLNEAVLAALAANQAGLWTALPGIVKQVDLSKHTVQVEPTIQIKLRNPDGSFVWATIPVLPDVPLVFPSGGGFSLTFPIAIGDEVLVIFASRCIDTWWQSGATGTQAEFRMHDLSDGFAIPGPRSRPKALSPAPSSTAVELRNDAHTAYVKIDGVNITAQTSGNIAATAGGNASVTASGSLSATAPTITLTGAVSIVGTLAVSGASALSNTSVTGTLTNNTKDIGGTHQHDHGTMTASGHTGGPL